MANFIHSKIQGLTENEINGLTEEQKSKKIDLAHALQLMANYRDNRIEQLQNSEGIPSNGFYFDASDIIEAAKNLTGENDKIYIALAKKSPTNTNDDYTLVVCGVEYRNDPNGVPTNYYKHHDTYHPWFEFSKPCPDECPKEDI